MLTKDQQRDYDILMHNACSMNPEFFNGTTTTKVAKELLKHSVIFNAGEGYKFTAKSRGLGVYDMRLMAI